MDELRTERLVGTRPLLRDADELHEPMGCSATEARSLLVREMAHWKRHRCGCWVWRRDGRIIGLAGLEVVDEQTRLAVRLLTEEDFEAEIIAAVGDPPGPGA